MIGRAAALAGGWGGAGDRDRTGMASLEDRGWIIVLTSQMLTWGNLATDDWSDRC
jgi:hypothetical protein